MNKVKVNGKKVKWVEPLLVKMERNKKTSGACASGSTDVGDCQTGALANAICGTGNMATTGCDVGALRF